MRRSVPTLHSHHSLATNCRQCGSLKRARSVIKAFPAHAKGATERGRECAYNEFPITGDGKRPSDLFHRPGGAYAVEASMNQPNFDIRFNLLSTELLAAAMQKKHGAPLIGRARLQKAEWVQQTRARTITTRLVSQLFPFLFCDGIAQQHLVANKQIVDFATDARTHFRESQCVSARCLSKSAIHIDKKTERF